MSTKCDDSILIKAEGFQDVLESPELDECGFFFQVQSDL